MKKSILCLALCLSTMDSITHAEEWVSFNPSIGNSVWNIDFDSVIEDKQPERLLSSKPIDSPQIRAVLKRSNFSGKPEVIISNEIYNMVFDCRNNHGGLLSYEFQTAEGRTNLKINNNKENMEFFFISPPSDMAAVMGAACSLSVLKNNTQVFDDKNTDQYLKTIQGYTIAAGLDNKYGIDSKVCNTISKGFRKGCNLYLKIKANPNQ